MGLMKRKIGPYGPSPFLSVLDPYILDGLCLTEIGKKIKEHYVDTGGFTDLVFAACALLGYRFIPRIRDLKSKRFFVFGSVGINGSKVT